MWLVTGAVPEREDNRGGLTLMAGEMERRLIDDASRRRRLSLAAVVGAVMALVLTNAAFGEPLVSVGPGGADGSVIAVAVTGDAHSSGGLAISGTGSASGGVAGVSGEGTYDVAGGIAVEAANLAIITTGVAPAMSPLQAQIVAMAPAPDPMLVAEKAERLAIIAPEVLDNMVSGIQEQPGPTPSPGGIFSSGGPPMRIDLNLGAVAQSWRNTCVPASMRMLGLGDEYDLAQRMGTNSTGTTGQNARTEWQRRWDAWGHDEHIMDSEARDAKMLMDMITTDAYYFSHGLLPFTQPEKMTDYWPKEAVTDGHAMAVGGYDHRGGGTVILFDPWDAYGNGSWDSNTAPNSLGRHEIPLKNLYLGLNARESQVVW
jgi:hypothetical protein